MHTKHYHSIKEIGREKWNSIQPANFPFSSYEFLEALESSNSIGRRTGWFPLYISVWNKKELSGASFCYLKTNSYGEYIFDWVWADAWQKSGLKYYPKLLSAVPFTPAGGPKILAKNELKEEITSIILKELIIFAEKEKISTVHFLFLQECDLKFFEEEGFTVRKTYQFHWHNENYETFDDFLMALKQKKRKEIRRERKLIKAENLEIKEISGDEIEPFADLMYDFYLSTIDKKWSSDYLTKDFFKQIFSTMKESIILYLAFDKEAPIAATLNFKKGNTLYGRYWGCSKDIPKLHFELCYYRPIEYAIKHNLILFEAGAQGEHKIQRGFIPSYTYSAHLLPEHGLGDAVKDYINREAEQVDRLIKEGRQMAYK